jgi:hypothetical protein
MPWIHVDDRLPPLDQEVHVAGDYIAMDPHGRPLYGPFPRASRRQHHGLPDLPWYWSSAYWRATTGIRWWWSDATTD